MSNNNRLNYTGINTCFYDFVDSMRDKYIHPSDNDLHGACSEAREFIFGDNVGLRIAFTVEQALRTERIWEKEYHVK